VALLLPLAFAIHGCDRPQASLERDYGDRPVRGGTLRMVQEAPSGLDPLEAESVYEALPVNQLYDGLVSRDAALNLAPALASDWSVSRDGRTYRFVLRENVAFHDGSTVTADDVVFTFRRALDRGNDYGGLVRSHLQVLVGAEDYLEGVTDDVRGIEAIDSRTVRFRLERPCPSFLETLTMDGLAIVPRAHLERNGVHALRESPIGTGPFRLSHRDDTALLLEANDDYFGGRPHLDAVYLSFRRGTGKDAGVERFLAGALDVVEPIKDDLPRLQAHPEVHIHRYQELSLAFLGMDAGIPPLDRLEVRQAIAHAIDRRALVSASPSTRREAVGIVPPGMTGYSPAEKTLPHDPQRARDLLARAGYGPARPLPPIPLLNTSTTPSVRRALARIASDLERVGIRLDVVDVSWPELGERMSSGRAPLFLLGWIADLSDPQDFLRGSFETGAAGNCFGFSDPEVDRMMDRARVEMDPVRRSSMCQRLERRILERAPLVPLYHSLGVVATRANVRGLDPGPFGLASVALERVWIDDPGGEG
jgi:ABC-type transport system substrate-binding protein